MLNLEGARLRSCVGFASSCGWRRSAVGRILTSRRAPFKLGQVAITFCDRGKTSEAPGRNHLAPCLLATRASRRSSRADNAAANFTSISDDTAAGHNYRHRQSGVTSETCRSWTKYRAAAISVAPNQTASKCCPETVEGERELSRYKFKPLQTKTGSQNRQVPNVARLEDDLSRQ
jgi:hypothetical protein